MTTEKKVAAASRQKKLFDEIKGKMVVKILNLSERESEAKLRKNANAVWKDNYGIVCCPDDDLLKEFFL